MNACGLRNECVGEWSVSDILKVGAKQLAVWQTKERPQHASKLLEFEHAALLRDRIKELQIMK